MKTEAVLFTGKDRVEFGEVETPETGPGDVLVATHHSWISNGTEGSFLRCERYDGIMPWLPFMPLPYPMVAGYQKVGVVEAVGKDVREIHEGQWVFATITKINNVHLGFGGHVARGPSDANQVLVLPDGVDPVIFSGLVLTQVGYNSGSRPPVEGQPRALVIGDGMVGIWSAQTLQFRGAAVALAGKHPFRLGLLGANANDQIVNALGANWLEEARDWAGGEFDIVVDTVGNEVNYDLNMRIVPYIRRGGHFVTAGHEGNKAFIDLRLFISREITIHCPAGWTRPRLESTLALVHEGELNTQSLITDRLPARDAPEAWRRINEQKDSTLGVVLDWQ